MYEIPGRCVSAKTIAAVTTNFVPVKLTENGLAPAGADDAVLGFVQREGIAGEVLPVMVDGITMAIASAAIAKGAFVGPTTGGKLVAVTEGNYCGIAMEAATSANDVIPVLIRFGTIPAAEEDAEEGAEDVTD